MLLFLLLTILFLWTAYDYGSDLLAARRETARRQRKAELRQTLLAREPNSPAAHERLGDALREADDMAGAIGVYEEALRLRDAARATSTGGGGGWSDPSGALENKLHLARLAWAQERDPAAYGQTLETRQQICRACGTLCPAQGRHCEACGALLPVDGFWDTLRLPHVRSGILRETGGLLVKFLIAGLAIAAARGLPGELRGCVIISTIIVVPLRLLKRIGPDG